jgi:hypothetical protein
MNDRVRHTMVAMESTVGDWCARCPVAAFRAMSAIVAGLHVLSETSALS